MNEFESLIAYMKIAYHNMATLHRHLIGDSGWFGNHDVIGDWYKKIGDQIDDLAEIALALRHKEPSIKDAVLLYSNNIVTCESRDTKESLKLASETINGIRNYMRSAEALLPADVVNKLQEYEYEWNKISLYKIASALASKEEEDD